MSIIYKWAMFNVESPKGKSGDKNHGMDLKEIYCSRSFIPSPSTPPFPHQIIQVTNMSILGFMISALETSTIPF